MSRYRRVNTPGATYFFTVVTYRRRSFLCDADVRLALREAISQVRSRYPFRIDAWVLLIICIPSRHYRLTTRVLPCAGNRSNGW